MIREHRTLNIEDILPKGALSAMRKHSGYGPFGRIPSLYVFVETGHRECNSQRDFAGQINEMKTDFMKLFGAPNIEDLRWNKS